MLLVFKIILTLTSVFQGDVTMIYLAMSYQYSKVLGAYKVSLQTTSMSITESLLKMQSCKPHPRPTVSAFQDLQVKYIKAGEAPS